MMAMIANISALTLAAINLATPLLCKLPKLENFTLLAYKFSMSLLALLDFYLAALIATAKSQKAANSFLAKIVKIGVLVKVVSTIVPQAASLEATADLQSLHDKLGLAEEEPSAIISAVTQTSAELPCNLTSSLPGDKVRLVLWFLASSATPLYTYDTRGKSYLEARHWSDDAILGGRAFFRGESEPGRLVLDNVNPSDAGIYKCRVDFRTAPTRITAVLLDVLVPPEKPVIYGPTGEEVRLKLGPYTLGQELSLTCAVLGGRPAPEVSWWRDHRLVDSSYQADSLHRVSNHLQLGPLKRSDLNSIFTCQAANNNVSVPVSTSVKLDLTFGPSSVRLLGAEQPMSAGRSRELVCEAMGGRPRPTFTWWKGGVRMAGKKERNTGGKGIARNSLKITPSAEEDGQEVICKAELPGLVDSAVETNMKLKVTYMPILKLNLGSALDESNIKEGNDVYFECSVRARPAYTRLSWWKDGEQLEHDLSKGVIISNQSIVLQGVKRKNSGNYTCRVANTEGEGVSNVVTLAVQFAPVCASTHEEVHGVARTETLALKCRVLAHPSNNLTFRWIFSKGEERVDIEQERIRVNESISDVEYEPRTELDYGTLLCLAENTVGSQQTPCMFHVVPAGRPDPVSNCTVSSQSSVSFTVDCLPGFDGGAPQAFKLEVVEVDSGNTSQAPLSLTSRNGHFTVSGLRPIRAYIARVIAFNAHGESRAMSLQAFTTQPPLGTAKEPSQAKIGSLRSRLNISPVLGVLIGVGSGLFLVASILGTLLCCRARYTRLAQSRQSSGHENKLSSEKLESRRPSLLDKLASPDLIPGEKERRYSCSPGVDSDYQTLQHIHSNITTINRSRPSTGSYSSYSDPEALYARVRRGGRGKMVQVMNTSSETGDSEDLMVGSMSNVEDAPLVTPSYSTESDDLGVSMETTLIRDSSAEDGSLASVVVCVDRESRV